MTEPVTHAIILTEEQLAFIEALLIECPYKHVAEILATINEQRNDPTQ